jgi:hypothetical protein
MGLNWRRNQKTGSWGDMFPTGCRRTRPAHPGAFDEGIILCMAVFTDVIAGEQTDYHPVALGWPTGGPPEVV